MRVNIILLIVIAFLMVMNYAMLVAAGREDRRDERMYEEWKHERSDSEIDK